MYNALIVYQRIGESFSGIIVLLRLVSQETSILSSTTTAVQLHPLVLYRHSYCSPRTGPDLAQRIRDDTLQDGARSTVHTISVFHIASRHSTMLCSSTSASAPSYIQRHHG